MRTFDLSAVSLRQSGPFLSLEVPGLAEGRPSLLMGDRAVVCMSGGGGGWGGGGEEEEESGRQWEGYIHEVGCPSEPAMVLRLILFLPPPPSFPSSLPAGQEGSGAPKVC